MRIYLIGYMASGKSKLGQDLSVSLGFDFLDLDEMFEERYHISILDFFEKYDEQSFRGIERELLHETAGSERVVIATGGGTPCFYDNMSFILNHGLSVYLYWEAECLSERLIQVRRKRPLIKDLTGPAGMVTFIQKHLKEREVYYKQAGYIFDAQNGNYSDLTAWIKSELNFPVFS